jgi:hypothetical protein
MVRQLQWLQQPVSYLLRTETAVFLIFWLLLMIGGRDRMFKDPGSLWHVVVGERIVTARELPHVDAFSYTSTGEPWIAQWWLGECALALVHRVGGLDGILLTTATIQSLFLTWLAYRFLRSGMHPLLAVMLTGLAFLGIAFHFHPRPHLITILFMGWTFARLCDFEAGQISLRSLFWFVPVYLLWANVHGGMVGGLATMALALAGWWLARWLGRPSPFKERRDVLVFGSLILACGLTAFLNPYGAELPRVWLALFHSPVLPRLIEEHAPLLTKYVGWTVVLFALVYGAALLGVLPKRPRVTWLIPFAWLYLAWGRSRHGPLFTVTASLALAEMFPHIRWAGWLARKGSDFFALRLEQGAPARKFGWAPAVVAGILLSIGLILQKSDVHAPLLGRGWARLDQTWPTDLLPELREYQRTHAAGTPVFNDMFFGGFLIYYAPQLRVFIDDRCELYGDDQLVRYAHSLFEEPTAIEQWRRQYHFDLALVVPATKFDRYFASTKGWRALRRTDGAVLYRWLPAEREPRKSEDDCGLRTVLE